MPVFTTALTNAVKIHTSTVAEHVTPQSRKPRGPAPGLDRGHVVTGPSLLTPPTLQPLTCGWVCRVSVWHTDPRSVTASKISHTFPVSSWKVQNTTPPASGSPASSKPSSTLPHLPRHFGLGACAPIPSAPVGRAPIPSSALTLLCTSEAHQEAEGRGPRDRHPEMWGVIKGSF